MKKLFLSLLLLLPMYVAAQEANVKNDAAVSNDVFTVVEQMPQFPGGQQALFKYLMESIKYPIIAKENRIQGRALCQFIVEKDGSISSVEVIRSAGDASLDKEAIRLLKGMPNWTPGMQRGKPVRVLYTVPVNFKLDSKKSDKNESAEVHNEQNQTIKKMGKFKDGESFYVVYERNSKSICAPNGIIVSPNEGYVRAKKMESTNYMATITMQDDTMFVYYEDIKSNQVFKIERYLYDSTNDALSLDGEQVYMNNNVKYCGEIIANGKLKRTIWYNTQGQKERVYMYKAGTDISEIQLYPSGKTKIRTEHFGTPEAVQKVYDEDGNEAVLTEASCFSEMEQIVAKMLIGDKIYRNDDYHVAVTTSLDGKNVRMLLSKKNGINHNIWMPFNSNITPLDRAMTFAPATIGDKPVSYTFYMDFHYRPFEILLPTSDDSIMMKVFYTGGEKSIYSGIECNNHYFAIADDNAETQVVFKNQGGMTITNTYQSPKFINAVIHRDGDTLLWNYDYDPFTKQSMVVNENGDAVLEGWQRYYKDGVLDYAVLFHADTMALIRKYYPGGGSTHYEVDMSNKEIRGYYPTGELKMREIEDKKKDKNFTYYTKQGKEAEAVMPAYPGGAKALKNYLKKDQDIKTFFKDHPNSFLSGWMNIFIEVDETGHLVDAQRGALETTYNISRDEAQEIYNMIVECLRNNPTLYTPGTIDGEPQNMRTVIRLNNLKLY